MRMLKVLGISIALTLAVSPISLLFSDNIEDGLKNKSYYSHIYDYTSISLGNIHLCYRKVFNDKIPKGCELEFTQNQMDNVVKIINILNQISYVEDQSDPNIAFEYGGNCQAISLLAHAYLDDAGIKNEIIIVKSHMYNTIYLENRVYKLDATNSIFKEINNEKFREN